MNRSGKVKDGIIESDMITWKNENENDNSDDEEKKVPNKQEEDKEQSYTEAISIANNVRIVGKQMSFNSSIGHSASKMIGTPSVPVSPPK